MSTGAPDFGNYPDRFTEAGKQYAPSVVFMSVDGNVETNGTYSNSVYFWGHAKYALDAGTEYVQFRFFGSFIGVVIEAALNAGIANVYIDGELYTTIDTYYAGLVRNRVYTIASGLTQEDHTIKIAHTGTKNASSSGTQISVVGFTVDQANMPSNVDSAIALKNAHESIGYISGYDYDATTYRFAACDADGQLMTSAVIDTSGGSVAVEEQGTPTVRAQGWDGTQWRNLAVDSSGKAKIT